MIRLSHRVASSSNRTTLDCSDEASFRVTFEEGAAGTIYQKTDLTCEIASSQLLVFDNVAFDHDFDILRLCHQPRGSHAVSAEHDGRVSRSSARSHSLLGHT